MSSLPDKKTLVMALIATVLGLGSAGLAACGDENELIFNADQASAIKSDLDEARGNVTDQDCNEAEAAVGRAREVVNQLSGSAGDDVIGALDDKLVELQNTARRECEDTISSATEEQTTTTETDTTTAETDTTSTETTPTETTPTETTETTPTETVAPTVPTVPTVPVEPPGNGGGTTAPGAVQ